MMGVMSRPPDGITDVADGIWRITRADVNCYLIDAPAGPVLVDGGLPRSWPLLLDALAQLGRTPGDIIALYLTHAHFDHVGMGDRLLREYRIPVHVHDADAHLARHPYRYAHESPRVRYPFRYPATIPGLVRMTAAGALGVKGVEARSDVEPGRTLPGTDLLEVVATPGHTNGHCSFLWRERSILFVGDALVTYDPYTGGHGPQIVARAATGDSAQARAALNAIAKTEARMLLPGHGGAFMEGAASAAAQARAAGVA